MALLMNDPSVCPFILDSIREDMGNDVWNPACLLLMEGTVMLTLAKMFSQRISAAALYLLDGVLYDILSVF